ncbi:MAG: hypothetical protein KKA41_00205 [Proteobacteria bacterium]|nr:hypothetical protein [Pseudomonadota bacterium]
MRLKWFLMMIIFIVIGLSDSVYLTYHHYQVNILKPAKKSFCTINQTIDCDKAASSVGATLLEVPVATWGMFAFTFLLFFILVERLLYWEVQKALYCFVFVVIYAMAAFSAYEAFLSFFVLKVVCLMCLFLYILMALMVFSCKHALNVSHHELALLLYDLFFRSFSRTLLRKGISVSIIALVFSGVIAFGLDHQFRSYFSYMRVDMLFFNPE